MALSKALRGVTRLDRLLQNAACPNAAFDDFLADNPFYTKRFAFFVGRRCRASSIQDVARETHLNWKTVKALEMQYMREQLRRAGSTKSRSGKATVSDYRERPLSVAADLVRWTDRSEASLDEFFAWLGPRKSGRIQLAAVDMWRAFRKSTTKNAPAARILFDEFHVLRHLSDALDQVRKSEYKRLSGRDRRFIKGQKYTLLAHRENLTLEDVRRSSCCSAPTSGSTLHMC